MTTPTVLLHIHAQRAWHEEAVIIGNRDALVYLKMAIERVLMGPATQATMSPKPMATDGEGYPVWVWLRDDPWDSPAWFRARLPYTGREEGAVDDERKPR